MKETEWTFKIPNVLKEAVKQNKAFFQIFYQNENEEILKSITIHKVENQFIQTIVLRDISEEELERQIDDFIYGDN